MKDSFKLRHNISVFLAIYLIFCIATLSGCENVDKGVGKSEKITRELKQVNSPTTYKLVRYSSNEENINNFKNYINEMEEAYIGKDGSLSVEDADSLVNFFYEQVTVAKEEGVFELAEKGNRSVLVKFKDGPSMAYIPSIEGYQAGGQEAPTIFTYELSKEISKVFNLDSIINTFIKNFKGIADSKIDWYKYSDKQGLKDSIDRLEQYNDKVIVVNGHGGYTPSLGSFLISGAKFDPNIHSWDNLTVDQNDNVLITSDMVKELIKDGSLKNSLVIVNACNSTFDMSQTNSKNKFSQTLLDKGASAVVGFNSLVTTESASRATAYILENISVKGENGYPSLQDIVAAFKGQLEEEGSSSKIEVYGNRDFSYGFYANYKSEYDKVIKNIPEYFKNDDIESNGEYMYAYVKLDEDSLPELLIASNDNDGLSFVKIVNFNSKNGTAQIQKGIYSIGISNSGMFRGMLYSRKDSHGIYHITFTPENGNATASSIKLSEGAVVEEVEYEYKIGKTPAKLKKSLGSIEWVGANNTKINAMDSGEKFIEASEENKVDTKDSSTYHSKDSKNATDDEGRLVFSGQFQKMTKDEVLSLQNRDDLKTEFGGKDKLSVLLLDHPTKLTIGQELSSTNTLQGEARVIFIDDETDFSSYIGKYIKVGIKPKDMYWIGDEEMDLGQVQSSDVNIIE